MATAEPAVELSAIPDDSEVASLHPAHGQELGDDRPGGARRNGEPDALGLGDYGRVDPYDQSPGIEQRASGITGVGRGGVLNDVLDETSVLAPEGPAEGADNTRRDRRLKPEGVSHGDDELPHPQGRGIGQGGIATAGRRHA